MKKFIMLAGMMLACITGFAQMQPGLFSITPKMGFNVATMSGSGNANSRMAFVAGVDFEYQINRQFAFGLGAIYSQQGVEDDPWTLKTDYITLPLTAFYYPVRGLGIYVGVEPAILVRKKAEIFYKQYSEVAELPKVGDVTKRYIDEYGMTYEGIFDKSLGAKRGVVSLPIGINYEFDHCVFGIKYSIGLGNAISGPGVSCTHNVFQISLGYRFNVFGDIKKVEYKREKNDEQKGVNN
jgi:hypothetical protein